MPKYEKPPRAIHEMLVEHIDKTYPGTSLAFDAGKVVTHVQNDDQSEAEFSAMMKDLQAKFPGAF